MPCNCKKPLPEYPSTYHWGPPLWSLLHSLSVRVGTYSASNYANDEKFIWMQLFPLLPSIIPCADCRDHLKAWMLAHPLTDWPLLEPSARREWLTTYFYDLHEDVNRRLGKPSFDKSRLTEVYSSLPFREILKQLKPFMDIAIRHSGITLLPWQRITTHMLHLLSIYGM